MAALLLTKRLVVPHEVLQFEKGDLSLVQVGRTGIARARYQPGWIWSEHALVTDTRQSCDIDPVGMVESGVMTVDGGEMLMRPRDVFGFGAGHDDRGFGDEPYDSRRGGVRAWVTGVYAAPVWNLMTRTGDTDPPTASNPHPPPATRPVPESVTRSGFGSHRS